jgi:hypothetical protein
MNPSQGEGCRSSRIISWSAGVNLLLQADLDLIAETV